MSPATTPSASAAVKSTNHRHQIKQLHRPLQSTYNQDCWSPDETHALIDAWGSIHLSLNRGSLRHHQWSGVADAVNSAVTNHRRRTDVQCKNRIDTLKKKYKTEKPKVVAGYGGYVSPWPFFDRLDFLIAGDNEVYGEEAEEVVAVRTPVIRSFPVKRRSAIPKRPARWLTENDELSSDEVLIGVGDVDGDGGGRRREIAAEEEEKALISSGGLSREMKTNTKTENKDEEEEEEDEDEDGCGKLAEAIRRFGEVYERVELVKQEKLIELEKHRMEFAKDLEFQRIKLLMDTQHELFSRIKRSKLHHHSNLGQDYSFLFSLFYLFRHYDCVLLIPISCFERLMMFS